MAEENQPVPAAGPIREERPRGSARGALCVLSCLLLMLGILMPRLFPVLHQPDKGPCQTLYMLDGATLTVQDLQNLLETALKEGNAAVAENLTADAAKASTEEESPEAVPKEDSAGEKPGDQVTKEGGPSPEAGEGTSKDDSRQDPGESLPKKDSGSGSGEDAVKDSSHDPGDAKPKEDSDPKSGDVPKKDTAAADASSASSDPS